MPWCAPFPILNQSVPCPVLTVASWPAYRFLMRQVRWSDTPISLRIFQFVVIHIVKGFSIVSETKVDVFLELPCFFHDPANVGNLISGSSAFSLVAQLVKNPLANAGDLVSIPGLGRSPGEGKGYPLQYFGLENSIDCIVHGITKSPTQLSTFHST